MGVIAMVCEPGEVDGRVATLDRAGGLEMVLPAEAMGTDGVAIMGAMGVGVATDDDPPLPPPAAAAQEVAIFGPDSSSVLSCSRSTRSRSGGGGGGGGGGGAAAAATIPVTA